MESVNAQLTTMVQENAALQSRVEQLEQQLERRAPSLFLTPASRYTMFSDGKPFRWELFPHEGTDDQHRRSYRIPAGWNDCSDIQDPELNEEYWNAHVHPCAFDISFGVVWKTKVTGLQGYAITIRDLVRAIRTLALSGRWSFRWHCRVYDGLIPEDQESLMHGNGMEVLFLRPGHDDQA